MPFSSVALHLLFLLITQSLTPAAALPLSTDSRWIVDEQGQRVKLACANWAAHLEPMVAEGLGKQPVDVISQKIAAMGFNCVRLTWALYMVTNQTLASFTVQKSLVALGLVESAAAVAVNNPSLVDVPLVDAFRAVVSSLSRSGLMVILDNQISKPEWCCSKYDGNGFFGDEYFDPEEWIRGLTIMAAMFNGTSNVVGMSLRNELRGPKQNVTEWYRYMQIGAEAVHSANPDVLVILSGLDYDKDLSYLSQKQIQLSFTGKIVFELHWYGFSDNGDWADGNVNDVCGTVIDSVTEKGLFLLNQGWPLFLGEFGVDQGGKNIVDNRFLSCFVGVAAELDFDWAVWALQGNYYIREGILGYDETYGLLGWDWCKVRSPEFTKRISVLQSPLQDPGITMTSPQQAIFHPLTGLCVQRNHDQCILGSCLEAESWHYTDEHNLLLKDSQLCLLAEGLGKPAKLGTACNTTNAIWTVTSNSKMHLSSRVSNGTMVCLEAGEDGIIVTDLCECILGEDGTCDPEHQWFKIITTAKREIVEDMNLKSAQMVWSC